MTMKKTFAALMVLSLLLVSCGKKETVQPNSDSGLVPANFTTITPDGDTTHLYVMKNSSGMEVCVSNIGARVLSVLVPDKNGQMQNVVLGHDNIESYMQLNDSYGAVIGRYANRIAEGSFMLDRVTYRLRQNNGKNTLHGGPRGFQTQYFEIEQPDSKTLICTYFSKHNDENFPGNVDFTVTYTLTDDNALDIDYMATTDRATVINVTNHSYFNLSGKNVASVEDHQLFINADSYTVVNEELIPTGDFAKVKNTALDYTTMHPIDLAQSYDLNYVLNKPGDIKNLAAKVHSSSTGINMEVYTTEPGMQFFIPKEKNSLCLETQHFPDSPNHPNFPSTTLRPDSAFTSKTIYKFGVGN